VYDTNRMSLRHQIPIPECEHGRDHDVDLFRGESILRGAALIRFHPGMIMSGADSFRDEVLSDVLSVFSADAVNDRRLIFMPR